MVLQQLPNGISEPTLFRELEKAIDLADLYGFVLTPDGDVWRLDKGHIHRRFLSIFEVTAYLGALHDHRCPAQ